MTKTEKGNVNILLVFWFSQQSEIENLKGVGNNISILFEEQKDHVHFCPMGKEKKHQKEKK